MNSLTEFKDNHRIKFVLTDIDDTLTDEGLLGPQAYQSLWDLHDAGLNVIPITGRPAGWCEMIARVWPVAGVVGENGGFYFRYHEKKMKRHYVISEQLRFENQKKLQQIEKDVLSQIPGCAIASDQFARLLDLAIDFCEDVPALPKREVQKIVDIFHKHGAQAKISSIHVNGWFGNYNKLSESLYFLEQEFGLTSEQPKEQCAFVGDSPNDEPMWTYFPYSFGVANVKNFLNEIKTPPRYIASLRGGLGFAEIAKSILQT